MSTAVLLDTDQSRAVAYRHGPVIVVAGPGAGKTRVLTSRAGELLKEGVQPERILLLTFTRAAANTMTTKARAFDERAQFVTAGTFHSWAIRLINANAHVFGLEKPFTMLDQDDVAELIKQAIGPLKETGVNWPRASTVGKVISYATNTRLPIAEAVRIKAPDYAHLTDIIAEIRDTYVEMKIDKGLIDYDDVLAYMAMLLEDEELGAKIRAQYDYVMIDEYQDTNELQLAIVHGLVGENGNVMVVGDASQSIYSFRGGAPSTMKRFHDAYPQSKVINLETNYRSTPEIVALVNAIDKQMDNGFERTLTSSKASGARPKVIDVADGPAEAIAIAEAVLDHKAEGGEVSDHAVLVRSAAAARRIEAEFMTRGIPYRIMGGVRIDEAAHIRDLLSLARLTTNLAHEPAWLRLLGRFRKIGTKAAADIAARVSVTFMLAEACEILREEASSRKTNLDLLADALEGMAQSSNVEESLEAAILHMSPIWSEIWHEDWSSRARDLEAVLVISREHPNMESFLTTITLDGSMNKEYGSNERPDEDPVTISTIHSSKGLEWPHVHVPAFVQGGMPSMFSQGEDDMDEELRVFYVAASRAEKSLSFYRPRFNGQHNFTSPSIFEPIILPYVDQSVSTPRAMTPTSAARVETDKKIDLKARMLGRK